MRGSCISNINSFDIKSRF